MYVTCNDNSVVPSAASSTLVTPAPYLQRAHQRISLN
jgi:hypothetical protein